jgi:hypothetical protein
MLLTNLESIVLSNRVKERIDFVDEVFDTVHKGWEPVSGRSLSRKSSATAARLFAPTPVIMLLQRVSVSLTTPVSSSRITL